MSEAYSDFALVYDRLMDNIPYDEWFHYISLLLDEFNIKKGIIAELGCGTGAITERLAAAGYDMIGIDNAPAMLDIAQKKKEANGSSTLYLNQDMRGFELYGTVSAIISVCDSVNYILDSNELTEVFRLVNNYLDPKGIFIFDFNTCHYYLDVVADATIAEDREDISFIWDNLYDEEADINELYLSLFIRDNNLNEDNLYRKYEELHLQKGYTLTEMLHIVKASGLELVCAYDAFTKNPAAESSERIYIIARECGK
ncbi:MAG: class I SAM-dependent methyltransferase [Clostridium sp.]|nr:class I SAM-dependent methyltransferase [Clostridium sp.]MCM1171060.1 class I SAM-dependent methyltransferase [Clostridium sp.]MCM1209967.1 class I SAM-dependent methyltransferase [Ruminococcus sp.]